MRRQFVRCWYRNVIEEDCDAYGGPKYAEEIMPDDAPETGPSVLPGNDPGVIPRNESVDSAWLLAVGNATGFDD